MIYFKQCKLVKPTKCGKRHLTSWLPVEYAVKGKWLELKNDGVWENGWQVESVGRETLDRKVVESNSRDYRIQRKASDIVRRKN